MRINVRFDNQLVLDAPGVETELHHIARALERLAAAQERIATAQEPQKPRKATAASISTIQAEPLASPPEGIMQFKIGIEGCKATLVFNGKIDGEPTLAVVGGSALLTVDPKTEIATEDPGDPDHFVDIHVVLHFKNSGELPAGVFGVSGTATADNPETSETETITIDFPAVGEYIPQTQAKANTVSLVTEAEPL